MKCSGKHESLVSVKVISKVTEKVLLRLETRCEEPGAYLLLQVGDQRVPASMLEGRWVRPGIEK